MAKLDVRAFGLACGIVWGAGMFIIGLMTAFSTWGAGFERVMSTLYIGFSPTLLGSVIGAAWGFVDAGIGGLVVALIYNKLSS